jgi:hypothetical protein
MPEMSRNKHEKADPTSSNLQGGSDAAKANTDSPTVSDSSVGGGGGGDWTAGLTFSAENKRVADQFLAQQASDKGGASAEQMTPPEQKKPEG